MNGDELFPLDADPRQAAIDKAKAERAAGQAALPYMTLLHGTGKTPAKGKPQPSEGGDETFDGLDELDGDFFPEDEGDDEF